MASLISTTCAADMSGLRLECKPDQLGRPTTCQRRRTVTYLGHIYVTGTVGMNTVEARRFIKYIVTVLVLVIVLLGGTDLHSTYLISPSALQKPQQHHRAALVLILSLLLIGRYPL